MVLVYLAVPTAVFCSGVGERCWQAPSSTLCSQAVRWDALAQLLRSHTHTHTNTQLHQCEQVSVQTIVEVCECSGFVSVSVWWFGGRKKKSSHRIYVFYLVTTRRRSRPIPLDYSWEHVTRFLNAKRALCTPITRSEPERQQGTWTEHSSFYLNVPPTLKNCITFSLFFFFLRRSFRHEPNGRSRERVSQMLQGGKGKDWEKFRGDFGLNTLVRCAQARCGSVWRQLCLLFPDCWVIARLCAFGDVVNPVPDVLSAGCSHQL